MTIRRPQYRLLSAEYEVYEDANSDQKVGIANVVDGVIERLAVKDDVEESYKGQVLSALLHQIVREANQSNSNLSIKVPENEAMRLKRFLERFNFRGVGGHVFKRVAGAMIPPSVPY